MKREDIRVTTKWVLIILIGVGVGCATHSGGFGLAAFAMAALYTGIKAEE